MIPPELELRDIPRKPFRCPAWVTVNGKTIACRLVDLSEAGAGLVFEKPDPLPESFTLHLVNKQTLILPSRVAWQKGVNVGVVFFVEPDEQQPAPRKRIEVTA